MQHTCVGLCMNWGVPLLLRLLHTGVTDCMHCKPPLPAGALPLQHSPRPAQRTCRCIGVLGRSAWRTQVSQIACTAKPDCLQVPCPCSTARDLAGRLSGPLRCSRRPLLLGRVHAKPKPYTLQPTSWQRTCLSLSIAPGVLCSTCAGDRVGVLMLCQEPLPRLPIEGHCHQNGAHHQQCAQKETRTCSSMTVMSKMTVQLSRQRHR